jgi:hypothetical protein
MPVRCTGKKSLHGWKHSPRSPQSSFCPLFQHRTTVLKNTPPHHRLSSCHWNHQVTAGLNLDVAFLDCRVLQINCLGVLSLYFFHRTFLFSLVVSTESFIYIVLLLVYFKKNKLWYRTLQVFYRCISSLYLKALNFLSLRRSVHVPCTHRVASASLETQATHEHNSCPGRLNPGYDNDDGVLLATVYGSWFLSLTSNFALLLASRVAVAYSPLLLA